MNETPLLQVVVEEDDATPRSLTFSVPRVTLGKDDSNLLQIESTHLSRQHGVFHLRDGAWFYEDRESMNGTWVRTGTKEILLGGRVEGKRSSLMEVELKGGEILRVGASLRILVRLLAHDEAPSNEHIVQAVSDAQQALACLPSGGELRLLFESVREISRCGTEDEVLRTTSRIALTSMPTITHIFFVERVPGAGWQVRWSTDRQGNSGADESSVSRTLLDEALDRGMSQLYTTVARETNTPLMGDTPLSIIHHQISSSICVPLKGFEGELGVLQAECRANQATLTDRDLHLMTLLSEQAAVMLDRLRITVQIQRMFEGVVNASVKAIESRDPTTAGHSTRVADHCLRVAQAINESDHGPFGRVRFGEPELRSLRYAALLHDFGKIGVKSELLLKGRKLLDPALDGIRYRFRLAKMESRARAAEDKLATLRENPASGGKDLERFDRRHADEVAELDRQERWLMSLMDSEILAEPHLDDLRKLTEEWHGSGVRLLEPGELMDMLSCGKGTLTSAEYLHVQEHAKWTRCYLDEIPWSPDLVRVPLIAGDHHEKLNRRGYPRGLGPESIALEVRILTVCDIYDALTDSDRPYRRAWPSPKALAQLDHDVERGAVDGDVLDVFKGVLRHAGVI